MDYEIFMAKALEEARRALDRGELPVGSVMVYEDRVLVTGARHHSALDSLNELDHAEMLALRKLIDHETAVDRQGVTLFSTLEPCLMCYAALILNDIRHIVYAYEDVMGGGLNLDLKRLNPLYQDIKVTIVPHVLRQESVMLFKAFFSNPENTYLQGSLLAEHTLRQ